MTIDFVRIVNGVVESYGNKDAQNHPRRRSYP